MTQTAHRASDRSLLREQLTDQELADLEAVIDAAEQALGPDALPPLEAIHDFDSATAALHSGWAIVRRALREGGKLAETVTSCDSLDEMLHRLHHTEDAVRAAEVRHRDRSIRVARETLAGLQDMTSVQQLVDAGATAVCRLGFDRAFVSSVQDSMWMVESLYVDGDSEWAEEIMEAGQSAPQQLHAGLPEGDLVRRRRPIVVTRVQQRAVDSVHAPIAEASQSRSYVAAPIMPRSKVIGFLHGDRYFHRGDVSAFDSDLLGLFAQGYGFALERALLLEELHDLRAQVRRFTQGLDALAAAHEDSTAFGLRRSPDPTPSFADVAAPLRSPGFGGVSASAAVLQMREEHDGGLTRRELEVLKLMANGDTNVRIAHKLIISEGTVKSHVKHILRKLGAANRAEAVARWHAGQHPA